MCLIRPISPMKLFTTTASTSLSKEIATILGISLAQSEVVRFENSEVRVRINENVSGETCVVLGSSSNPTDTHLMELFFFADALKRGEAAKIIGIIPYFGYARQNIQHRPGEAVSANVIIRFLELVGYNEIATFELHDEATAGVFTIPFSALSAYSILSEEILTYVKSPKLLKNPNDCVIVSPDQGGVERARYFGEFFYGNTDFEIAIVEKNRDQEHVHSSEALDLYGDVKDKAVILVDDVVTSAGTLINAANMAKERGATQVIAAVTHHDFGPDALKKIQESVIDVFFTSDSIALKPEDTFDKLHEVSIAPLIATYIKHE